MSTGIVYMDDTGLASKALFATPGESVRNYINNSVRSYVAAVKDVAPNIASFIQERYEAVQSAPALRYISNLKQRIHSMWKTDMIRALTSVEEIQQAPPSMRRWIMANPEVRERYQNGGVEAYDHTYVDLHPITIGVKHYDYRRVTENVIRRDENGELGYRHYYENQVNQEDILTIVQKGCILGSWDIINRHFESDDNRDPVSVWNATL